MKATRIALVISVIVNVVLGITVININKDADKGVLELYSLTLTNQVQLYDGLLAELNRHDPDIPKLILLVTEAKLSAAHTNYDVQQVLKQVHSIMHSMRR